MLTASPNELELYPIGGSRLSAYDKAFVAFRESFNVIRDQLLLLELTGQYESPHMTMWDFTVACFQDPEVAKEYHNSIPDMFFSQMFSDVSDPDNEIPPMFPSVDIRQIDVKDIIFSVLDKHKSNFEIEAIVKVHGKDWMVALSNPMNLLRMILDDLRHDEDESRPSVFGDI